MYSFNIDVILYLRVKVQQSKTVQFDQFVNENIYSSYIMSCIMFRLWVQIKEKQLLCYLLTDDLKTDLNTIKIHFSCWFCIFCCWYFLIKLFFQSQICSPWSAAAATITCLLTVSLAGWVCTALMWSKILICISMSLSLQKFIMNMLLLDSVILKMNVMVFCLCASAPRILKATNGQTVWYSACV